MTKDIKNPETIALHGGEYRSDPTTTAVVAGSLLYSPPCKAIVSGFFISLIIYFLHFHYSDLYWFSLQPI